MLRISVAELITTRVVVTHAEAAALTVAIADALIERGTTRLPPHNRIFLSSTGHVSLWSVTQATDVDADATRHGDVTAQLTSLLRRVLQLDEPASGDRRRRVPGPLLVLLARSLPQMDLPALELTAFRDALARFGRPEPTLLAAMFWRAARMRPSSAAARTQSVALLPARAESTERRRHSLPPAELRRYLREMERELYETRSTTTAQPIAAPARLQALRVSSAIAATIVGAVVGTFAAFTLSGGIDLRPDSSAPAPPAAMATNAVTIPQPAAGRATGSVSVGRTSADRSIQTTRTVQPLLLAASVGADVFSPSFSPRGHTLLFHAGRKSAPLMRASMTDNGRVNQVEKLLDDGAANYHVTMSPDGQLIAFDSDRDGTRGVYVAHADGTRSRRVSGPGHAAVPSWSPDGSRLAFVRAEPGSPRVWNVWIVEIASGALTRITRHSIGQPWGASWFPDGRRIAYSLEDRLMVANLDSGMASGYRSPRKGRLVRTPAVSPDGRRIVFQVQRDGVWLLDVERARMQRILPDATAEEFVWSPEGDAIAYHARSGGSYGLWRLALGGGAN